MLLSEMFGVKRDKPFTVIGLLSVYKIGADARGIERIERVNEYTSKSEVVCGPLAWRVIAAAPSGIIRLLPPLTDEQREQLKVLWKLGYRWLAKDNNSLVYSYSKAKPEKLYECWAPTGGEIYRIRESSLPECVVRSLVSWSDPEPYDIGKALGVEGAEL